MNTHRKCSAALASIIAMILAVPGTLRAAGPDEDGNHANGRNKGGDKTNEHYNIHYNIHSNNHYDGPSANNGPYHPGYYPRAPYHPGNYARGPYPRYYPHYYAAPPCTNCGSHHHNNHDHDNDELWMGLLGGGILGYGLSSYLHSHPADQGNTPTAISVPPPPGPTQYATTAPVSPCLQQREYSTKIMVGGRQVDGYGMACLQPDGSWRYGAAQPESY